ncbi:MAG TPA: DeoR/GlpR transcriptional regulator [Candidatus Alectryocaccomicrobium excrementavium]|uniref:DeoR/GlpR transcriptional regulator n=1 Tax=Candidatus Alectryocaccomicrobium excrementavium TaxID=2840668 RepID=A0A9D1K6B6_9FIRM|nr:DeoR/GlpR transcriptional regulator [Candidatus Alectryocaccomicrobium excrementavium]
MQDASKKTKMHLRRKKIMELLAQNGEVRIDELAQLFGTTEVTIRSDLSALEEEGGLQRTTGGAIQTVRNFYNLDFLQRAHENIEYKQQVGRSVAELIRDGETLMINAGATMNEVARALKTKRNLSIVTDSVIVALELGGIQTFKVILLGGNINVQYAFTHGADALEELENYRADHAILSIDGISAEAGLTTYHSEEAVIDRSMMKRSRSVIIAADFTKIGHESFSNVSPLNQKMTLITNDIAERGDLRKILPYCMNIYLTGIEGGLQKFEG